MNNIAEFVYSDNAFRRAAFVCCRISALIWNEYQILINFIVLKIWLEFKLRKWFSWLLLPIKNFLSYKSKWLKIYRHLQQLNEFKTWSFSQNRVVIHVPGLGSRKDT